MFKKLRREILAARLKVTLDEQLNRKTSPTVRRLSEMKLPPIIKSADRAVDSSTPTDAPQEGVSYVVPRLSPFGDPQQRASGT
ncbi:hypothetical protein ANMWB30_24250 [Arthrobacter sp. MWB30]|nr:hypothetical protein ANMWB30_24250 [Arthrobacter sp. MWB30]